MPEGFAMIWLVVALHVFGMAPKVAIAPGLSLSSCSNQMFALEFRSVSAFTVIDQVWLITSDVRTRLLDMPESKPGSESLASNGVVPVQIALPSRPALSLAGMTSVDQVGYTRAFSSVEPLAGTEALTPTWV